MTDEPKSTDTRILKDLLDPSFQDHRVWHPQELSALLEHQWKTPLQADLANLPPERSRLLKRLCEADGLVLKSYCDLFSHPLPPIELLDMIKDYAKRNMIRPHRELPEEIAQLLYVLSVVLARLRWDRRITTQNDSAVCNNIRSLLSREWLTPPVAELLREGLNVLSEATARSEDGSERE